jgi:hypothetical protein
MTATNGAVQAREIVLSLALVVFYTTNVSREFIYTYSRARLNNQSGEVQWDQKDVTFKVTDVGDACFHSTL